MLRQGLSALEASKKIDFGPYAGWHSRRAVHERRAGLPGVRDDAADMPWDSAKTFDAIYAVARAKGIEVEF